MKEIDKGLHHITINNQVEQSVNFFCEQLQFLLSKNKMGDLLHYEAKVKDLENTLAILNTQSEKIGIKPGELMDAIEEFTEGRPLAR
jgi:hypothetical protein